ncbi:MAG: L,D-transpeptidase family protein [Flavisolibacter sp.]
MKREIMTALTACLILASCTQVAGWFGSNRDSTRQVTDSSSISHAAWARDESITPANSYSDLFLDSAAVENYISREKLPDTLANDLRHFYLSRNYQYAWFTSGGLTEQARGLWNVYPHDSAGRDRALDRHVDSLVQNDSLSIDRGDTSYVATELSLTRGLVSYTRGQSTGPLTAAEIYYLVPVKKQDPLHLADSLLQDKRDSVQQGGNKAYSLLKQQLAIYVRALKDSGWKALQMPAVRLSKGRSAPLITDLKKRMAMTGDYGTADTSRVFNDSLVAAIKDFQQRNGLAPSGQVNDSLLAALNVPAEQRVEQILVNMNRLLWMPTPQDSNRIIVNIPSQLLYAYNDSGEVFRMPVIVGKEGTSTMMFRGDINQIVFHPVWHLPASIVRKEVLPRMKEDPAYLQKNHMEVVSRKDSVPEIRELPGKDNPLGAVKFVFPNSYDIYLHDTPDKSLFAKKDRALSHGCIRVADAEKLSAYLLRDQQEWTPQKLQATLKGDKEQEVSVKNREPVFITYNTAWVDEKGRLNFRNDIYGHDAETINRMFQRPG